MAASPKQIKLIEDLLTAGAPYPPNPRTGEGMSECMLDSVEAADKFIKQHYHLLARKASLIEMSHRVSPSDYGGIPNH